MLKFWQRWRLCSLVVVLEVLLVHTLALTASLVQALGPVVLVSRKLQVQVLAPGCQVQLPGMVAWRDRSRCSLRWRLSWKPRAPKLQPGMPKFWGRLRLGRRLFELVLVQVLALTTTLVLALGPGCSRRGKRRWRRWLMPPLAQFPLLVERRRVEREKPLVRVVGLVSRLL